jgi:hypothetical protein
MSRRAGKDKTVSARNPLRYIAPATKRKPKPLSRLTRPQLAARVHQLREALGLLWSQSETDGYEPFACIGRMKVELINLEERLREIDGSPERGPRLVPAG